MSTTNFNDEYFFLAPDTEKYPRLESLSGTALNGLGKEEIIDDEDFYAYVCNLEKAGVKIAADCFSYEWTGLIISEQLKCIIEELDLDDIQFVPITIIDRAERKHENYYVLNVYKRIDCMDKEKSVYKLNPFAKPEENIIGKIDKVVLDNEVLKSIPLEERLIYTLGKEGKGNSSVTLFHKSVVDRILLSDCVGLNAKWLPEATLGKWRYYPEGVQEEQEVEVKREELMNPDYETARHIISTISKGVAQGEYFYELLETSCGEGKMAYEDSLINWAKQYLELQPILRELVESIISYSSKFNHYLEDAGESVAVYLACENIEDVDLFIRLLESYDLDHSDEEEIAYSARLVYKQWEGRPEVDGLSGYIEYLEILDDEDEDDF